MLSGTGPAPLDRRDLRRRYVGKSQPQICIVVVGYNIQPYLATCLRSVQEQHGLEWECVVVDDGSTDLTLDLALDFAVADPRFRVFHHRTNQGAAAARNTGLDRASAPFVTFLDGDDFLYPESLASRYAEASSTGSDVAGVYCDWMIVPDGAGLDHTTRPSSKTRVIDYLEQAGRPPFVLSAPLLHRDVVMAFGGFNETMTHAEDIDLWMRILRHGYRFVPSSTVGVAYRQRQGGLVHSDPYAQAEGLATVLEKLDRPLEGTRRVTGTPHVYDQPLGTYLLLGERAKLLTGPLALAVTQADDERIREILALIPHDAVVAQSDLEFTLHTAVRRLEHSGLITTGTQADEVKRRVRSLLRHRHRPTDQVSTLDGPALHVDAGRWIQVVEEALPEPSDHPDRFGGVVMVPEARYHAQELCAVADVLRERGVNVAFVLPDNYDPAGRVRQARRHLLRDPELSVWRWPRELDEIPAFECLVVMNDWGPTRTLVVHAQQHGIPTVGKVEGVQDFEDADTGRSRLAYRTVDTVLCQGRNDQQALAGASTVVVGSARLEQIWQGPERIFSASRPVAVINSNFTYNVLTDRRDAWLSSALAACRRAGIDPLVSQHPADKSLPNTVPVTVEPMELLLQRVDVLISRFSTVPFEAMARGVPFVYHNPHGEQVPTFTNALSAFNSTTHTEELAAALKEALSWRGGYRSRCAAFFARQVDMGRVPSAERTADAIVDVS